MNIPWEIAKISFYLLLVLGLIYLLAYFLKNNISRSGKGKQIKVIEQVYLSPKKSLALITVHDTIFLISNSNEKVSVLKTWDSKDFPELKDEMVKGASFKEYFQQIINDNRRGSDD
ncbi:MAG: flagellar biosynthetic protein FliO [Firmicutes bacterium]|nr:flagellar biosynthetic protein FliO [Bacillota bacterium]